jgi:hypothetical protein
MRDQVFIKHNLTQAEATTVNIRLQSRQVQQRRQQSLNNPNCRDGPKPPTDNDSHVPFFIMLTKPTIGPLLNSGSMTTVLEYKLAIMQHSFGQNYA